MRWSSRTHPPFKSSIAPKQTPTKAVLADYSPFTIAEFRDWLRQGGLYAPGQPFAGEAWEFSSRYAGDAGPGSDTNGDGHTLNGDFLVPLGIQFGTWNLKYFDWSLGATPDGDTGRDSGFYLQQPRMVRDSGDGQSAGFDAPEALNAVSLGGNSGAVPPTYGVASQHRRAPDG